MKQTILITLITITAFAPAAAFAALVTVSDDTTLTLPSDGSNYTLTNGSTFDEVNVSNSSFTFNMIGGESATLTSADRRTLSSNPSFTATCGTSQSSITISLPSGAPAQPIIITPGTAAATCSSGEGGGGSPSIGQVTPPPSGGGGGVFLSPAPTPTAATPPPAKPSAPSAPPATPSTGTTGPVLIFKNLSWGNRGNEVRKLQLALSQDRTLYPEGIINGVFGPATFRAVKRFQKKYGIPQTGFVGPATRAKLMKIFQQTGASSSFATPPPAPTPSTSTTKALQDQLDQLTKQLKALQNK